MNRIKLHYLAGEEGFEPSLRDPESRVLPLDDSPEPAGKASQTRTGVGQKIQSFLPNPLQDILSPPAAESDAPPPRLKFFQGNGDFRHITKHLTVIGISLYILNGRASAYNKVATAVSGLILVMVSLALLHWVAVGAGATETSSGRSPTALPDNEAEVAA